MRKNASLGQLYGNMQEAYHQMQTPLVYQSASSLVLTKLYTNLLRFKSFEILICSFDLHITILGNKTLLKRNDYVDL